MNEIRNSSAEDAKPPRKYRHKRQRKYKKRDLPQLFKKGHKKPANSGRKKGQVNRINRDVREIIRMVAENLAPELEKWIKRAAKRNPAKAADLWLRAIEYHIPKLSRVELEGAGANAAEAALAVAKAVTSAIERVNDVASAAALYRQLIGIDEGRAPIDVKALPVPEPEDA